MDTKTTIWVAGVGAVALLSLILSLNHPKPIIYQTNEDGTLAGVPGPDRTFPVESRNGVAQSFTRLPLKQATSTVCAIQAPTNATSTLNKATIAFTTGTTSAVTVTLAKASTFNSTTTDLTTKDLGAGTLGTISVMSTTTQAFDPSTVFSPGQWFVVGVNPKFTGSSAANTFFQGIAMVGSCSATFDIN